MNAYDKLMEMVGKDENISRAVDDGDIIILDIKGIVEDAREVAGDNNATIVSVVSSILEEVMDEDIIPYIVRTSKP